MKWTYNRTRNINTQVGVIAVTIAEPLQELPQSNVVEIIYEILLAFVPNFRSSDR